MRRLIPFLLVALCGMTPAQRAAVLVRGGACAPISPPSGGIYDAPALAGSTGIVNGGALALQSVRSPDCLRNGATFTEDTSSGGHNFFLSGGEITHTFTAASVTVTVYVKQGLGNRNLYFEIFDSTAFTYNAAVVVNPNTGAVVTAPFTSFPAATASSTQTVGQNGYTKVTLTVTPITQSGIWIQIYSGSGNTNNYAGNGAYSLVYWGAGVTSP